MPAARNVPEGIEQRYVPAVTDVKKGGSEKMKTVKLRTRIRTMMPHFAVHGS